MIACLFTELNQNQVQKVSRHGRELLARFGPSCVLSGNLEHAEDLLPPPSDWGRGTSLSSWESPEREKPRLLGTLVARPLTIDTLNHPGPVRTLPTLRTPNFLMGWSPCT